MTTLESGSLDAFPFFSAFPTAYTQPCAFLFLPSLFFNFGQSLLKCPGAPHSKQPFPFLGNCPIVLLSISNICVARISAVAGKVPYLVTFVAFLSTRVIVMKMALGALGPRSTIWLLFSRPNIVDLGDIMSLEGLLLMAMAISGCIISLPFVISLPFRIGAEFLIHQVFGQL
ncbi:hypothetical protein Tco_0249708, partial [Tanacetum coccineum]